MVKTIQNVKMSLDDGGYWNGHFAGRNFFAYRDRSQKEWHAFSTDRLYLGSESTLAGCIRRAKNTLTVLAAKDVP